MTSGFCLVDGVRQGAPTDRFRRMDPGLRQDDGEIYALPSADRHLRCIAKKYRLGCFDGRLPRRLASAKRSVVICLNPMLASLRGGALSDNKKPAE
jgi:hypothetical protein